MSADARRILVAYATRHGSTAEVAAAVAERLRAIGHTVELRPAGEVVDLPEVDAVVLGGALYTGRWHRDARRFLLRHREALRGIPLAVFAMGPRTLETAEVESSRGQLQRALDRVPELSPEPVAVFGGVVDPASLPFPFSRIPASDARDWQAIEAWADAFSVRLARSVPA